MESTCMSIDEVKSSIDLKTDDWKNGQSTNCYAFALGLDIPGRETGFGLYQLGRMGSEIFGINFDELKKNLGYEDRLKLDLRALNILFMEVDPNEEYDNSEHKNDKVWYIAYFKSFDDFHFLRKGEDGIWYHKQGFQTRRIYNTDDCGNTITDPSKCFLGRYKYKKTYRLTLPSEN